MLGHKEQNLKNRLDRFIEKTGGEVALPDAPDEELNHSYDIFIDDLENIKVMFTRAIKEALKGEEAVVKEFSE